MNMNMICNSHYISYTPHIYNHTKTYTHPPIKTMTSINPQHYRSSTLPAASATRSGEIINNGIGQGGASMPFKPNTVASGTRFSMFRMSAIRAYADNAPASGVKPAVSQSMDGGSYIERKKALATKPGRAAPTSQSVAFKSVETNSARSALSRVRGGGSVAPKKKGARR